MNIQDLSGKPEYKKMREIAYKKADVILLCYTMNDGGKSLENLEEVWINQDLGEFGPDKKADHAH